MAEEESALETLQTSRIFGHLQSVLFSVFALAVLLDRSDRLFGGTLLWRYAGGILCVLGIVLLLVAIRTIGRSIQIAPAPKADASLATHGVYAWFRHPIYTGILAVVVGLVLRQPTTLVLTSAVVVVLFLVVKVRFEERLLLARYPDYREYRRRAWGVIPFLT